MTLYVAFFALQILLIFGARSIGARDNTIVLAVCVTMAVLFAALRGDVGVDTSAYRSFYEGFGLGFDETTFEPTFMALAALGHLIGADSQFLVATVAVLQGVAIFLLARRVKESDLLYLVLLANFYIYLSFNLVRVGLALYLMALALLSIRQGRERAGQSIFILAVLTHFSVVLMAPAIWRRWYRAIPFAALFVVLAWDTISHKLLVYFLEGSLVTTNFSLGIGFVAVTLLLALVMHWERLWSERLFVVLFVGATALKVAGLAVPIIDRLAIVLSIALTALIIDRLRSANSRRVWLVIALYGVYGSLSFVANSDDAIDELIAESPGMARLYADPRWVPYRFYWER